MSADFKPTVSPFTAAGALLVGIGIAVWVSGDPNEMATSWESAVSIILIGVSLIFCDRQVRGVVRFRDPVPQRFREFNRQGEALRAPRRHQGAAVHRHRTPD